MDSSGRGVRLSPVSTKLLKNAPIKKPGRFVPQEVDGETGVCNESNSTSRPPSQNFSLNAPKDFLVDAKALLEELEEPV